jgi:hypothetical protein
MLPDALVLPLATARLTRLITEDTITEPLRVKAAERSTFLEELTGCAWCSGVWAAGAVLVLRKVCPPVVTLLAVAQAGTLLHLAGERV